MEKRLQTRTIGWAKGFSGDLGKKKKKGEASPREKRRRRRAEKGVKQRRKEKLAERSNYGT